MGKSQIIRRVLETYVQVPFTAPTRRAVAQAHPIVHLTVRMPADGSRGGLLYAILLAIDGAVNTDYFNEYDRAVDDHREADTQVPQLLALYSVGFVVIKEMQDKNFISISMEKISNRSFSGFSALAFRWC